MKYRPHGIEMGVTHARGTPFAETVLHYAELVAKANGGFIARYMASDGKEQVPDRSGDLSNLTRAVTSLGERGFVARFWTTIDMELSVIMADEAVEVNLSYPAEEESNPKLPLWVDVMVRVARAAVGLGGFEGAVVARRYSGYTRFVPSPPLARLNHLVTVDDDEVNAAYKDPAAFWRAWDSVEPVGAFKVCTRGLRDLDEISWMARTFESQMAMARAAAPKRTIYATQPSWDDAFAPWWKYGDLNHELAGFPAISPNGYNSETRTLEYVGYISRAPLEEGGPEPRHVLIRELLELYKIARRKKDGADRVVDAVNVVFLEEWMARSECRPLLDVGVNVFYLDKKRGRVQLT